MSKKPIDNLKVKRDKKSGSDELAFTKKNYYLLIIGVVLVIIGFILMAGGGSDDISVFNPEIFNHRRLTVAPIFVMLGYTVVFVSIMKRFPKERAEQQSN